METNPIQHILDENTAQAETILKDDPSRVDKILEQLEAKLKEVPAIGGILSSIPLMVSMVKSYITGDYKTVSPKVIALLVGSMIYLLKKKDLISDNKAFIGYADDIAVFALALKLSEPELQAFSEWRKSQSTDEVLN